MFAPKIFWVGKDLAVSQATAAIRESLERRGINPYLSMNEATAYTGLCSRTLRRAIADGSLRAYRAGRVWRFKKRDLDAMFAVNHQWGA